jgi:hypothetical protein
MASRRQAAALDRAADRAAGFLRAIAHPARLRIICALIEAERSANDLGRRREATSVFYSLVAPRENSDCRSSPRSSGRWKPRGLLLKRKAVATSALPGSPRLAQKRVIQSQPSFPGFAFISERTWTVR